MKKSPRKSHRQRALRKAFPVVWKVSAISAIAAGVGFSMLGPARYSAIATELLPGLSFGKKTTTDERAQANLPSQLYHFSMSITGGQATVPGLADYRRFEVVLTTKHIAEDSGPRVILRLQQAGGYQPVYEYTQPLTNDEFSGLWQQLRTLEAAQLVNSSPYTEDQDSAAGRIAIAPTPSATYQFEFKDGVYDYPNSFEVHAPEQLIDQRYQALRNVMLGLVAERFGDVLEQ
ncbi:MAG: hypothetical protein AAFV85_15680 [Cyanobacteria bacterium J06634_6]